MEIEELEHKFNQIIEEITSVSHLDTKNIEEIDLEKELIKLNSQDFKVGLQMFYDDPQKLDDEIQERIKTTEEELEEIRNSNLDEKMASYYRELEEKLSILISTIIDIFSGKISSNEQSRKIEELNILINNDDVASHLASYNIDLEDLYTFVKEMFSVLDYNSSYVAKNIIPVELFTEINNDLIKLLLKRPEDMYNMDPTLFEKLIAEIFRKFGMITELTKRTRDGGKDIIAFYENEMMKNKYLIECKRYAPDKKVGIAMVQRLIGVHLDQKVTKSFLVTTSSFSKPAIEFAKPHSWQLELKDFNDIKGWLVNYFKHT